MKPALVNYLNLGLIVLALGIAFVVPFELFLLAYAILGPLHYLTEISWLHDRKYFTPAPRDWMPLWAIGIAGGVFLPGVFGPQSLLSQIPWVGQALKAYEYDMAFLGFGVALILVISRSLMVRSVCVLALIVALGIFHTNPQFISLFAVFLPSLIHVCIFTGLFMLWGALKGHSRSGYLTFVVFIAAGATAYLAPNLSEVTASTWAQNNFADGFKLLTASFLIDVGGMNSSQAYSLDFFHHPKALAAVRFLGFAYTYHYLNWFSKTSVIKWHRISAPRYIAIVCVWLLSVGLYLSNYALGLSWLFTLSFVHVVLEFPLDQRSIYGVGSELLARMQPNRAAK